MEYKPEFCDIAHNYALLGEPAGEMHNKFDVSPKTFEMWMETYPDFRLAVMTGGEIADGKVVKALFERATGYTFTEEKVAPHNGEFIRTEVETYVHPDVKAATTWLERRQPDRWGKKVEIDLGLTQDFDSLIGDASEDG
ncbi:MAG: hypothetical protein ACN2B6_00225 [Rickettsiales bacterium]